MCAFVKFYIPCSKYLRVTALSLHMIVNKVFTFTLSDFPSPELLCVRHSIVIAPFVIGIILVHAASL